MSFSHLSLACTLFVSLTFCSVASQPALAQASPLDTVKVVQKAIDTSDYNLFSTAVDVDTFLAKAVEDGMVAVSRKLSVANQQNSDLSLTLILAAIGDGSGASDSMVTGMVVSESKSFLQAAIKGGYLAGKPNPSKAGNAGLFSSGLKGLGKSRKEIAAGEVLSSDKGQALISAFYSDPQAGIFPLKLRMEEKDGVWQIKYLENTHELVEMTDFNAR